MVNINNVQRIRQNRPPSPGYPQTPDFFLCYATWLPQIYLCKERFSPGNIGENPNIKAPDPHPRGRPGKLMLLFFIAFLSDLQNSFQDMLESQGENNFRAQQMLLLL